jgi:hypothetical protein
MFIVLFMFGWACLCAHFILRDWLIKYQRDWHQAEWERDGSQLFAGAKFSWRRFGVSRYNGKWLWQTPAWTQKEPRVKTALFWHRLTFGLGAGAIIWLLSEFLLVLLRDMFR